MQQLGVIVMSCYNMLFIGIRIQHQGVLVNTKIYLITGLRNLLYDVIINAIIPRRTTLHDFTRLINPSLLTG